MTIQLSLERDKTAILIMDYQNRQLSYFSESFRNGLLDRANEVLAMARRKGIHIIYVEVLRGERTQETQIHPEIAPQPEDEVVTKRRVGPFSTTNLATMLNSRGIETLVLMGISTSGCVLSTVRWAADIDYHLIVLADCCADRDEEVQRVLTEKLFPRQATVVTSQDFLQVVGGT